MGTLMDKLNATNASKEEIRKAIERKKVSVPENTPLKDYPAKIDGIYPDALFWGEMNLGGTLPMKAIWETMTSGDGKIILAGREGNSNTNKIVVGTKNGWQIVTLPQAEKWSYSCFGGGKFVLCGSMFSKIVYSNDGLNWKIANHPFTTPVSCIAYGNNLFVAGSYGQGTIYSSDGATWKKTQGNPGTYISKIIFAFNYFFVMTDDGNVYKSKDLKTWLYVNVPWGTRQVRPFGFAYSDGIFSYIVRPKRATLFCLDRRRNKLDVH